MRTLRPGRRLRCNFGSWVKDATLSESLRKERADQVATYFEATGTGGLLHSRGGPVFRSAALDFPGKARFGAEAGECGEEGIHNRFAAIDEAGS